MPRILRGGGAMLSSLLRPKKVRLVGDRSPFSTPFNTNYASPVGERQALLRQRTTADFDDTEETEDEDNQDGGDEAEEEEVIDEDEDGLEDTTPLLPIFSAEHLDALPVYNMTHAIRLLVTARCETTLSWDQLRSPQVSQFLVKPILQEVRDSHFSRATLYALMSNCLQFNKEVQMNPGNSGVSKTRAMVCELLAIKLLKDFTTRELIDALSYDFDPLQGQSPPSTGTALPGANWDNTLRSRQQSRQARISCLEIAIRASAKRFLAHPLVVQQLEAIWKGTIVFHSAADNLHRQPVKYIPNRNRGYGTTSRQNLALGASPDKLQPTKQRDHIDSMPPSLRRSVTIYDPHDASLFKLSRLRVPRYRQFLSTLSFAILLCLFVAVLTERSLSITPLEVVFWFWSAGFMLDEIVGFNEQGFGLYLMSFWNTFDVGILLLLFAYYCLRLCGIVMPADQKDTIANTAYDILAANAVLLFPRLFSVMDHSRYFSQLLVAFRMMASDLVAVFILIMISCSGFFAAFTLSFGNTEDDSPAGVAYGLFQVLMGFTPAAWERWDKYNPLGKAILTLFLFICHFLIVTILITVLTNSFMAIVQNANDEHQFVFAVNTISMVKSDALFSYVAPTNILAWVLTPLRYCIPFRKYVKINRTAIKITHFPILFIIYAYERTFLRVQIMVPSNAAEPRGRAEIAGEEAKPTVGLFSPQLRRLREPSIATYRKDRALDEVFRRPFNSIVRDTTKSRERRKTSNVVNKWMQSLGPGGVASPPVEQDRSVLDRLEHRKPAYRRSQLLRRGRDITDATRSVATDPEEFTNTDLLRPETQFHTPKKSPGDLHHHTDADDELVTNDNEDDENISLTRRPSAVDVEPQNQAPQLDSKDYFTKAPAARLRALPYESLNKSSVTRSSKVDPPRSSAVQNARRHHSRHVSTATIVYNPVNDQKHRFKSAKHTPVNSNKNSPAHSPRRPRSSGRNATANISGTQTPDNRPADPSVPIDISSPSGRQTPKRPVPRMRPIMPLKTAAFQSAPDLAGLYTKLSRHHNEATLSMDIGSDLGDNKAVGGGFVGAIPNSFTTQMAYATGGLRRHQQGDSGEDEQRMSRLVLARMGAMEQQFCEVLHEVRQLRQESSYGGSRSQSHSRSRMKDDVSGGRRYRDKSKRRDDERQRRRERKNKARSEKEEEEEWVDEVDPSGDEIF